jgi:type III pantothenate kinase
MHLLVDIGNSRVKWALASNAVLESSHLADHASWQQSLLKNNWLSSMVSLQPITNIYYACVGNDGLVESLETFSASANIKTTRLETQSDWGKLKNSYQDYTQMGVDRWLAMMAAWNNCQSACLVIDCGTAITVDAIAADGRHLGGHIVAGVTLQKNKLLAQTAKIKAQLTQQDQETRFASNTSDAVNFGTLQLVLDYLSNSCSRFKNIYPDAILFFSGGDGELLSELLDYRENFHQDLVLEGIMLAARDRVEQ